jgi:hypothetical protein
MGIGLYSEDIVNDLLKVKKKVTPEVAKQFSNLNQKAYNVPGPMLRTAAEQNLDDNAFNELQQRVNERDQGTWSKLKSATYENIGVTSDVGVPTLLLKAVGSGFLWAWENTIPRAARAAELLQSDRAANLKEAWKEADVDDPFSRYVTARKEGRSVDIGDGFLSVRSDPEETATYQQLLDEGVVPDVARAIALQQLGKPIFEEYIEEAENKVQFTGARAEALRKRGIVPTVTPGRFLFKPFEFIASPQTEAYDFMTGVVDLALNWYADPANRVLKGVSAVSSRTSKFGMGKQKTFATITKKQADSMGFLEQGLQKVARQKPLEDFLASEDMVPFLSWLFDNRKNPATILQQSNFSLTRLAEAGTGYGSKQFTDFYKRLSTLDKRGKLTDDIAKADAVRKILKPNVLAAATDMAVPSVKKVGRFRKVMSDTFGKQSSFGFDGQRQFGQVYDNTQLDVNNLDYLMTNYVKYMNFSGVEETVANDRVNNLLEGIARIGDNQLARANFVAGEIKNDMLQQRNWKLKQLKAAGVSNAETEKFVELSTKTAAGYLEDAQDIGRYYGSIDTTMPVSFKSDFIKYQTETLGLSAAKAEELFTASYRYPTFENHLVTSITLPAPSAVIKADRALQKSFSNQIGKAIDIIGESAVATVFDNYYSSIFKPLALLRVAYLVRVQLEEQARLAASGINSAYKHPIQYMANLFAGTYKNAEGFLPGSQIYKLGLGKVQINQGYTDRQLRNVGRNNQLADGYVLKGKEYSGFNKAFYADFQGTASDPLARRIALIESSATENKELAYTKLIKELKTEGNELRDTMIAVSGGDGNPLSILRTTPVDAKVYDELVSDFVYKQRAELHSLLGGKLIDKSAQAVTPTGEWLVSPANDELLQTLATRKFVSKSGAEVDLNLSTIGKVDELTIQRFNKGDDTVKKAINDEVRKAEIEAEKLFLNKFPPKQILPDEYLVKSPEPISKTTQSKWNKATSLGFKWLSQQPANQLTRSPAMFGFYYENTTKLIAVSSERVKKIIIAGAKKDGVSKKILKQMENTPSAGSKGIKDPELISKLATAKATEQTLNLLYDISKKGDFWETTRFIFPFGGAYQEIFQTWGRLTKANLQFATRPAQLSLSGIKPNPVFDSEGTKGFFYANPTNGEMVFGYPGEGLIENWMLGGDSENVKVNLPVYASSVNLAASVLPGVGPVVRLPASYLFKNYPEEGFINKMIFGDFEPPNIKDPVEFAKAAGAYPAWLEKLSKVVLPKDENTVGAFGNTVMDTYRAMIYAGIISDRPEDRESGLEKAVQQAKYVYLVRFASQFIGPAGTGSPLYELETENGDFYFFQTLADDYRDIKKEVLGDDTEATRIFIEKYGVNPISLTVGKTSTVMKRPVTKEGSKWLQASEDIYKEYPLVAFYANPEPSYSDLSWGQIKDNYLEGAAVPRSPRQHAALQAKIKGFVEFTQWQRDLGIENDNSVQARALKKQYQDNLAQTYWGYGFDTIVGLPERPTINMQIEELERMAKDPRLSEYQAIKGLQAYLRRRQIIIDEVEKATGSKTIWKQSDNYVGMRDLLRKYGEYLVVQYPQFNSVYQNLLKSELQGEFKDNILAGEEV